MPFINYSIPASVMLEEPPPGIRIPRPDLQSVEIMYEWRKYLTSVKGSMASKLGNDVTNIVFQHV
jgi:hypothetical protein